MSTDTETTTATTRRGVKASRTAERRTRAAKRTAITAAAGAVVVGALVTLWITNPAVIEEAAGEVKVTAQSPSTPAPVDSTAPAEAAPSTAAAAVTLGVAGGEKQLDRCDGTFTQITAYEAAISTPVWAAHNNCGGDVLLPWRIGQEVTISTGGVPTTYTIVDARDTRKKGATTDDLSGLGGQLILQTCYYGADRMKFIGLDPVAASPNG